MHLKNCMVWGGLAVAVIVVGRMTWVTFNSLNAKNLTCTASFSQHYDRVRLKLSLNYIFRGDVGVINMSGRFADNSEWDVNRKIFFRFLRKGDLYYMISEKNLKLPGDSVNDEVLRRYEPDFFIYPKKEIYMRVIKQSSGNYLFMVDSIPTYICNAAPGG